MIFLLVFETVPTVWYFSIGFWNCSDSVVFFYWFFKLFRQCGIFLLVFETVPTVVFFYWFFKLFRQCGIFLLVFQTVPTVWYFLLVFQTVPTVWYFLLVFETVPTVWYFSIGFWNCSDGVVFFYWFFKLFRQCGIFCFPFYFYVSSSQMATFGFSCNITLCLYVLMSNVCCPI
jgi:hypothetical protein